MNDTRRRQLRLLAGYALALAALVFAARSLGLSLEQLSQLAAGLEPGMIVLATVLLLVHNLLNREAFALLARACGCPLPQPVLRRIWARSLLAKYIPGGIWQLAGRAWLMQQQGCRARVAWYAGALEQVTSLALCMAIALTGWCLLQGRTLAAMLVAAASLAALLTLPSVLPGLVHRGQACRSALTYAAAMPFYLAAHACLLALPLVALATWLFAGTGAGLLAVVTPGGLGIREAVTSLLAGEQGVAVLSAMLVARVATLAVELLLSVQAWRGDTPGRSNPCADA